MKYASTALINGAERVVVVLPLSAVPAFDPENPPQEYTYGVADDVEVGWIRTEDGEFSAPPPPTLDQLAKSYLDAVQRHLDASARAVGYDDIVSACSYAGYPNAFQAEAISFGTWRAAVWAFCYALFDEVKAGAKPVPTLEQLLVQLPTRVLP